MTAAIGSFVLAAIVAAILTPLVRDFALRRNLLDDATGERKIHVGRIPRLGGVAIIFAFYVSLACVIAWFLQSGDTPRADRPGSMWVLIGGFSSRRSASTTTFAAPTRRLSSRAIRRR